MTRLSCRVFAKPPSHQVLYAWGLFIATIWASAGVAQQVTGPGEREAVRQLFSRDNLVAWCIVPFDSKKRGPEERAAMLKRLGFKQFAYDWRAEHIPTFDAELDALKREGIKLTAFWVAPGELNRESRLILEALKRHGIATQLWVLLDLGADRVTGPEQERRVESALTKLRPLAEEAKKAGCTLALYNHGGWFGEPENQIAIIEKLKAQGVTNIGMVYNLHHGHEHLDRFPQLLAAMKPYLLALNINGMVQGGDKTGRKILPLGQGDLDLGLLRTIVESGYRGPIGILGHTMEDAEARLEDNLDGLDWLVPQLEGKPAGPRPKPRTEVPPAPDAKANVQLLESLHVAQPGQALEFDPKQVAQLVAEARASGNKERGAALFGSSRFACISCHVVGGQGGPVGPDLTTVGQCLSPEQIVEAVLWPKRLVKEGYAAIVVATSDGKLFQGYKQAETEQELVLREATTGERVKIAKADVVETREQGTLMPEGLASAMTAQERTDMIRFLMELGRSQGASADSLLQHAHAAAAFPFDRKPLDPEYWPSWQSFINRDRIYDYYSKEAAFFMKQKSVPPLLPAYPGLDGGRFGHWGNQNEDTWVDGRWNETDLGTLQCGVFRGAGVTVPKGVCVRLGERGEMSVCFNPETLRYEALWQGGFVKFTPVRHGFLDGLLLDGTPLPRPDGEKPDKPFVYHGFYRHGKRVIFSYRLGDVEFLDAPGVENGKFTRIVAPASDHPLAHLTRGGPKQWPQVFENRGVLGRTRPYAIDTIEPPFQNPWNAPLFFGGHDFLPDGSALLCTMQGDVWHVEGIDETLAHVRWRRVATGLHQALGLSITGSEAFVLGRDQITRLHDLNGDGEADFYECINNAYKTSPAGHDFICGLERDQYGNFYTASGAQGVLKLSPDGKRVVVVATGFRNPDGLALGRRGEIILPCSEGEWTPASMVCEIQPGGYYGYGGPKESQPPELPLVYLPRGLDNSSGAQTFIDSVRWGPLGGLAVHYSYGQGSHFLLLREQVYGQAQGAVVPLSGEFRSGAHRGRFRRADGQLYVSGMGGWNTFTLDDGCFQRVRYTGDPVRLPVGFHAHENGMLVQFSAPVDRALAEQTSRYFAQVWNYRYSAGYGSPEFSTRHPGTPGHDPLSIQSAHVLLDGKSVFLEIPDVQPVSQLHLHMTVDAGPPRDLFATIHKLRAPFTEFPGYRPAAKTIAAHPILADLALASKTVPNPWRHSLRGARDITIEAGKNLSFLTRSFTVRAGEPLKLTFVNPDVVPHNWALIRPGTLPTVGDLANKIISEPDAAARQYIPRSDDVIAYTDIVDPQTQFAIFFRAPTEPGRYPYLCTFPGHWMVMNGVMIVE